MRYTPEAIRAEIDPHPLGFYTDHDWQLGKWNGLNKAIAVWLTL
jgi:hypothetical protein